MAAIAARAGTTKPTVYAHFADKEALLGAALDRERDLITGFLFAAYERSSGRSFEEQVVGGVEALFAYAQSRSHGYPLLFGPWSSAERLMLVGRSWTASRSGCRA
ncbi:hypothetical protein ASD11_14300 [Aeromicrobium sp. Root495]|uniref:TetR/AcrR family transcriptional regulator n=1 Tax=Aeromicrobium sp. Root495 TaxID=1736550 RepID=UPI0006F8B3B2|nr:helix-turn-helix domain-containing protein [Aeromicrobium sp. Root495]KQY55683.1 hypothetical protein ASD11_14300 [Aeromicrobium sp. Root495]